jgi:peptidyl-prolyl cis-trans isomerase B (cyclophilin B)
MNPIVVLEIDGKKPVEIELYEEIAPISVKNFVRLVKGGFYDGLIFHRVIKDFMIQGGCPKGDGTGKTASIIGEFARNGINNPIKHEVGVISMARAQDYDSGSCQFFIVTGKATHLDGLYAAFGKVISNLDVILEVNEVETDHRDKPIIPVIINRIYVKEDSTN